MVQVVPRYEVAADVWTPDLQLADVMVVRVIDTHTGARLRGLLDQSRGVTFAQQVQNAALSIDPERLVWLDRAEWRWGAAWDGTVLGMAASGRLPAAL